MTGQPEAGIARELALCYTTISVVTDRDAGVESSEPVSQVDVFAVFAGHVERVTRLLERAVTGLSAAESDANATCLCRRALDGIQLPFPLP